jgi:hypothetical protein
MATPNGLNGWATRIRQGVILALGAFVIIDASVAHAADVIEWTAGLILIGIVPIDAIFTWWHNAHSLPSPPPMSPPPTPPPTPPPPSDPPAVA